MADLPVAIHFVANIPEFDVIRLAVTVPGAQCAHRRGGGAVGVFDEVRRGVGVAETGVDSDVRIDIQELAKSHEFVEPDVIRLNEVPRIVHDRRTFVRIADGVAPVIAGDEISPGNRHMPVLSSRSNAVVSGRKPWTLSAGMSETAPTWKEPVPRPTISRRPA